MSGNWRVRRIEQVPGKQRWHVLRHEWTFAATEQGRGSFVIGVCGVCGIVRMMWMPADQREGRLDLRGECPGAQPAARDNVSSLPAARAVAAR